MKLAYNADIPLGGLHKNAVEKVIPVEINAKKGITYYVRYSGYSGIFSSSDGLRLVDTDTANKEIGKLVLLSQ